MYKEGTAQGTPVLIYTYILNSTMNHWHLRCLPNSFPVPFIESTYFWNNQLTFNSQKIVETFIKKNDSIFVYNTTLWPLDGIDEHIAMICVTFSSI